VVKIGRLIDHPTTAGSLDYGRAALDLVFDPVNARGGIAGHVLTLVDADAVGSVERVIAGARRLASEGCLLILGPSVTDFAVPLIPVLDELQVPAINWSGSGLARGAWGFQLKVGSLPDEAGYLTRLIAARGYGEIALLRDGGPIGDEYAGYLRGGLDSLGIAVMTDLELSHADDAARCAEALRADEPPCVVYLGLGPKGVALCRAIRASGCTVPVIGNIGIGVFPEPALEGVVFTDVIDEANPVLQRFARQWRARFADPPLLLGLAAAHDLATTALEALRLAPALTAAGVRSGLERLRGLPAAVGAAGTTIGFAPWDRDGYKGPLIVYREIRDGRAVMHRS
jgi:ABC-type branched-subunit amino acid transport system substrate-binding protein